MGKSDVEELRLVPRIRLDFSMVKVGNSGGGMPLAGPGYGSGYGFTASGCNYAIKDLSSTIPDLYRNVTPAVKLAVSDIQVQNVVPARFDPYYSKHDTLKVPRSEIGRGSFFIRDLNFILAAEDGKQDGDGGCDVDFDGSYEFHKKLRKGRKFLLQKLQPLTLSYDTLETEFQFWVFEPISEDPSRMRSLLPHQTPGSTQPQTIIVKGLPCTWFAQPGSSQPSEQLLRLFFQRFGHVRDLETSVDDKKEKYCNVSVLYEKYEGCCNALEKLCSFSLQKRGDSKMTVDYEVAWKDYKPFKRVNFPFDEEMVLPQLLALQHRKLELKEELKAVKKKMDAIEAYKDSCSKSSKKRKKDHSSYDSRKRKASPYYPSKTRRDSSYCSERRGSSSNYSRTGWCFQNQSLLQCGSYLHRRRVRR